ncbi:hypothetical protein F5X68DRAFT_73624 [Plectosphaerella plurivora]|uniref:Ubiquitin-like protease family profile domain-containing protein n=1 Tax=Plectosphaerella plurivora TaxID=936078 RepID=A0A9P9ACI5_9PEZI|nr:hypothetical protein F5X68DRAFT_73624 [Plectosphaerella plurivora]
MRKIGKANPALTGGFEPKNSLNDDPLQPKKPGDSRLREFIKPTRGLVQDRKRPSDDSGLDDEAPPRKKPAGSHDYLEEFGTEVAEISDPNTKRTRIPRNPHQHNSHDPFSGGGGKPKPKPKMEAIYDSDGSDGSSHTESGTVVNTSKPADLQKTSFTSTKADPRFKISRASCLNSTYDSNDQEEDKQIYLGVVLLNLRPMTRQGSAVGNYDWLEVRPNTMHKFDYCKDFSPVLIQRSGGINLGAQLRLEFASSDDHRGFIQWVEASIVKLGAAVTITPKEHKTSDRLKCAFENSFAASLGRHETDQPPPPISPQQPIRSPPVVSPAAKEKTKRKLAQNMKADQSTSHATPTATPLDTEPSAVTVTRSSRRRTAASSGKPIESSAPDFISLDEDSPNPVGAKKTRGRLAAPKEPPPARWIDLHPEWVNAWDDKPLIYPSSGRDAAQITKEDIPRLEDNELLNDSLIIFSSRYLLEQQAKEMSSLLGRTYIFNPWFYKKLSLSSKRGIDYEAVKSWTSKVDLFAHDFIIVPVNESFHWYLAIICYPGKLLPQKKEDDDVMMIDGPQDAAIEPQQPAESTISGQAEREDDDDIVIVESDVLPGAPFRPAQAPALKDQKTAKTSVNPRDPRVITFDSLGGAHSPTCTSLREYLVLEAKHRHGVDIKIPNRFGLTAKGIPEQNDFNSCGAYLLGYLQRFFENPDGSVERIVLKQGPGWEIDPRVVRAEMRTAIMDARDKQNDQAKKEQEMKNAKKRQRAAERLANGTSPAPSSPLSELPPSEGLSPAPTRPGGWFKTKTRKENSQELALEPPKSPLKNQLDSNPRSPHQLLQGHTPMSSQTSPPKIPQLHAQEPSKGAPLSLHQAPPPNPSADQPSVTSRMPPLRSRNSFPNPFAKLGPSIAHP